MDNLTHSLIGLAAGEAAYRCTRARQNGLPDPVRATSLRLLGVLGGNLPDADLLWSLPALTGDRVAYLVEHRGITHSVLGCVVLALLLFIAVLATLRWRGHRWSTTDAWQLGSMSLLAVLLHLGMDALNDYGVHPFWPWDNRWYYGDSVFIVEPLFWLALAPLLAGLRSRVIRLLLGAALAAGCIALLAFHRFDAVWWSVPVLTAALLWFGARSTPRMASLLSVVVMCLVVGTFMLAHAAAMTRLRELSAVQFPAAQVLDAALSPAPGDPLCWNVILLQRDEAHYIARLGQLNLAGGEGEGCARRLGGTGTAPLRLMNRPVERGMSWMGEYTMPIEALARLARGSCDARRLASFIRAPFAARSERGWIIGDLRYDRATGEDFAELLVEPRPGEICTEPPAWVPPRADLGF